MARQTTVSLREAREAADLSIIGLAFKAGVNPRTIERIEAGDASPRYATLKVLADVLEVEVGDLTPGPVAGEAA